MEENVIKIRNNDTALSEAEMAKLITAFYIGKKTTNRISSFFYKDFSKKLIQMYGK